MSREPENLDMAGHGAFRAQRAGTVLSARASGSRAAHSWPRRLVRSLVLLDSWSPDSHHLSSPQAARSHVRAGWTRSGDLSKRQAAALLALDETTPWQV